MQNQLTLAYEEIKKVANRDYLRDNFKRAPDDVYYIELDKISEREGFNKRRVYEGIEELADSIFMHDLKVPLTLDILPDGRNITEKGHRRLRACRMLVQQGRWKADRLVKFIPNKSDVTERQRMADQYLDNNLKLKLKPIEQAAVFHSLKYDFGEELSNQSIADSMGVSRQKVDYLIKIASQPDNIKNEIFMADMNVTEAINFINSKTKLDKQTDDAEENSHKTSAAKTALPKDVNAEDIAASEELEESLRFTNDIEGEDGESKPLDLVGNSVAISGKKEKDGSVNYDESRIEIKQIQNCIGLADKIEAITNKFDIPEGSKKDISDLVKWLQNDLAEVRTYVHKNKKENKAR